jgi:serine/threonine protein kinase
MDAWAPDGFEDAVEIGRGGFGTVYRARDRALGRIVAIKRLDARLDQAGRQRFAREGRVMSSLSNHPNVVPVYGVGVDERGPYLVMPYLSRGSLADRAARGPVPWDEAMRVLVRLCGAVESAHRSGVLHRDIKPDNVLLSDVGEPQLTDFGIARMSGEWATTDGQLTGSLPYLAPEVLTGTAPSASSDVYALGATMHHLLSGRAPFTRDDDTSIWQLYHRIAGEPVPPIPTAPPQLNAVLQAAMAKDPAPRPPSAAALGKALQQVQQACQLPATEMAVMAGAGDPAGGVVGPAATPAPSMGATPAPERAEPAGSRRQLVLVGVAAVVVMLLLGAVLAVMLTRRESSGGGRTAVSTGANDPRDAIPAGGG